MMRSIVSSLVLLCSLFATSGVFAQSQADTDEKLLKEYFAKNKIKATRTPSGLYYVITKKGTGENAKPGQTVSMKYLGTFLDGKRFDGNMDEKFALTGNPFTFVLGSHQVIAGWDEGVQFFNLGSQGTLYLPSGIGYGPSGRGPIPPNTIMKFNVEVVGIR
jgi:FKBP-type peptidyl-prolyl cis-trans isomerase